MDHTPPYVTSDIPRIYVIDYGRQLDRIDDAVETLREAPAEWLHVHCAMPYVSRAGASEVVPSNLPMAWAVSCGPEEVAEITERVREWVSRAHDAGVDCLIPYICNQTMGGDPEKRTGMWWFYDHWDEFAHDVGPKPPVDPIDWQQREPDGRLHFNYPYRFPICEPPIRFAPCPNNPYWHDWLKVNVRLLADYGYDGVFVDNNIIHCHCEHCQAEFRDYLRQTYTDAELRERFGTTDVSGFSLGTRGDKVLWACAQPEYRRYLLDLDREEFVQKFGTDDPDAAIMSEAGNGYHWGHASDWWRDRVRAEHSPEEADRIFREGDPTSFGIETPEDLCLWADTQKYWAWSVGQRNAELREAAEEIRPGFVIVPNWGDMSAFDAANSRRLDGKNVRLNAPGSDVVFFEEEYYSGTVAPGYTFDAIVPYRYAAACGARSVGLPYKGGEYRALNELATVERAAWGGDHMFSAHYRFPDVRGEYTAFFDRQADWYRGMTPYGDVGICLSWDDVHFENMHHFSEVFMTARYFAENGALIDLFTEAQFTAEHLSRYRLVVLPHVQYLSAQAREAIAQYVAAGGNLLITGSTGAFDEHARPAERITPDGASGIAVDRIEDWLPTRSWQVHDLMDYHVGHERLRDEVIGQLRTASESEPVRDTRLIERCEDLVGGRLRLLGDEAPPTLRFAGWRSVDGEALVLHVVNYDAPGPEAGDGPVVPVDSVEVALPLRDGVNVATVETAAPWTDGVETLDFVAESGEVRFRLPKVEAYRVVRCALK